MSLKTRISRRIEWDMGHRVTDHQSLCRNLHGHRYVAEVFIEGPIIDSPGDPERGMVKDFGVLKEYLQFIPNTLDHAFMVYDQDPLNAALALFAKHEKERDFEGYGPLRIVEVSFIPTAENIAAFIFRRLKGKNINVVEVTVWETPNCKATVTE